MRMKTLITPLALAGFVCGMTNVASAASTESVDLTVSGTIRMGACTPEFDNNGTVDFGKISNSALETSVANDLGVRSTNLTITCDTAHGVGFTITDNAAASALPTGVGPIAAANTFGLGQTTGGVDLGGYSITMKNVMLDGKVGDVLSSANATTWATAANGGLADNAGTTTWSAGTAGADTVTATATTFVYGINVNAVLQDSTTLAIADITPLAGSATFTLVYL